MDGHLWLHCHVAERLQNDRHVENLEQGLGHHLVVRLVRFNYLVDVLNEKQVFVAIFDQSGQLIRRRVCSCERIYFEPHISQIACHLNEELRLGHRFKESVLVVHRKQSQGNGPHRCPYQLVPMIGELLRLNEQWVNLKFIVVKQVDQVWHLGQTHDQRFQETNVIVY